VVGVRKEDCDHEGKKREAHECTGDQSLIGGKTGFPGAGPAAKNILRRGVGKVGPRKSDEQNTEGVLGKNWPTRSNQWAPS